MLKPLKLTSIKTTSTILPLNTECGIQFGASKCRKNGIADVVLKDIAGHWLAIVECKSEKTGYTEHGRGQLRSYLSATDTRFGILASNGKPDNWVYCENFRSNVFTEKINLILKNTYLILQEQTDQIKLLSIN